MLGLEDLRKYCKKHNIPLSADEDICIRKVASQSVAPDCNLTAEITVGFKSFRTGGLYSESAKSTMIDDLIRSVITYYNAYLHEMALQKMVL
jgi:hypothetical protein